VPPVRSTCGEDVARQARIAVEDLVERTLEAGAHRAEGLGQEPRQIQDFILVGARPACVVAGQVKAFFGKEPRKDVETGRSGSRGRRDPGPVLSGRREGLLLLDVPAHLGQSRPLGVWPPR